MENKQKDERYMENQYNLKPKKQTKPKPKPKKKYLFEYYQFMEVHINFF